VIINDTQAEVHAEIGEVVAGTKKLPPFNAEKKFTVFKSLGKIQRQGCCGVLPVMSQEIVCKEV